MLAAINHYLRHILATATLVVFVGLVVMVEKRQNEAVTNQSGMDLVIKVDKANTLESIEESLRITTCQPVENHHLGNNSFLLRVRCKPEQRFKLLNWLLRQEGVEKADLVE